MNDNRLRSLPDRSSLFTAFFYTLVLLLGYLLVQLLAPFSSALLWAAILALALNPVYQRLSAALGGRPEIAAGLMTLVAVLLVIGPAIALLIVLAGQATDFYQWASDPARTGAAFDAWSRFAGPLQSRMHALPLLRDIDIESALFKSLHEFATGTASHIGDMLRNAVVFFVNLLIMLISLYFFFRNGDRYYRSALDLIPFPPDHKTSISRKLHDTFFAVIHGVFLIALLQGLMTGIGFALFGVPFSVIWGVLAAGLALLPVGGAALVWLPGAVYLYLAGSAGSAVLLLVWGVVLVTLPDNLLKPMIIGRKSGISSFFLFLAILGGLQAYGVLGILFGPLIVTLLSAFIRIYREEYSGERNTATGAE